jgi:hypothetical protein
LQICLGVGVAEAEEKDGRKGRRRGLGGRFRALGRGGMVLVRMRCKRTHKKEEA